MLEFVRTTLYANFLPFLALVIFIFFLSFNSVFDRRQTRLFLIAALVSLFMLFDVTLDYLLSLLIDPRFWPLRRVTSFFNFVASPIIPLLLYRIFADNRPPRWFYMPMLVNTAACFVSIFTGIIFEISRDNRYFRGTLFLLPFLIGLFYIAMLVIQPGRRRVKSKHVERLYLTGVALFLVIAMGMEVSLQMHFLTWALTAPAMVLYYLLLNIQSAILDPLTGAYNRRMYDKVLSNYDGRNPCDIAMLDINDFKRINDLRGHDAGDRYLIALGDILSVHFSQFGRVFRIGGDEFVLLSNKPNAQRFSESLERSRQDAATRDISFACGVVRYDPSVPIQNAIVAADQLMYADKKQNRVTL